MQNVDQQIQRLKKKNLDFKVSIRFGNFRIEVKPSLSLILGNQFNFVNFRGSAMNFKVGIDIKSQTFFNFFLILSLKFEN